MECESCRHTVAAADVPVLEVVTRYPPDNRIDQAARSVAAPIGSQRIRSRRSSGAPASSRSIASRPSRKCFQPS